jgi:uncharacterized protein YuzE
MADLTQLSDEQLNEMYIAAQAKEKAQQRLTQLSDEELQALYDQSVGNTEDVFVSGFDEKTLGQYITDAIPDVTAAIGGTVGALLTRSPAGGAAGASLGYGKGKVIQNYLNDKPIADKELFLGMAQEAALDVTGAKAMQVFGDAYRGIANSGIIQKLNPLSPNEVNSFYVKQKLQEKLSKYKTKGGTQGGLSLTQVMPESGVVQAMSGAGESAVSPSTLLKELEEVQIKYLNDEISKIKKVGSKMKGEELGVSIQNLIENTRAASDEYYDKLFLELAEQGKVTNVNLAGAKAYVNAVKAKALKGVKTSEKGEVRVPFKDRTKASKGTEAKEGSQQSRWLDPKVAEFVSLINQLETKQNFNVAYDKLKIIKKKVAQLKATPENKPILRDLVKIEKSLEDSIIRSADNPAVEGMYRDLMASYSKTVGVNFSTVANKLFDEEAPEVVAKMLFANNRAVNNMSEFRLIVDMAEKRGVSGGKPLIGALRKGWLISTMKGTKEPAKAMQRLRVALEDPDKRQVYDRLMDDRTKKKVRILMDEFDVLEQRANKELSLVVRGEQTAGARQTVQGTGVGAKFVGAVRALLPTKLPDILANQGRINELLKLSTVAKKLDDLASINNLTRAQKEMKGRLTMHFFKLSTQVAQTSQDLSNEAYRTEFEPQLQEARDMLSKAFQSEQSIQSVPN